MALETMFDMDDIVARMGVAKRGGEGVAAHSPQLALAQAKGFRHRENV